MLPSALNTVNFVFNVQHYVRDYQYSVTSNLSGKRHAKCHTEGFILQGIYSIKYTQLCFRIQTVATKIGANWSGFHDPHSHVTGYNVNIGKCATCEDILEKSHVGITTSMQSLQIIYSKDYTDL